jgi:hypothetical protein
MLKEDILTFSNDWVFKYGPWTPVFGVAYCSSSFSKLIFFYLRGCLELDYYLPDERMVVWLVGLIFWL